MLKKDPKAKDGVRAPRPGEIMNDPQSLLANSLLRAFIVPNEMLCLLQIIKYH